VARVLPTHESFYSDEKIVQLSYGARFFFRGLTDFADAQGNIEWEPRHLATVILADVNSVDLAIGYMAEIQQVGLVEVDA